MFMFKERDPGFVDMSKKLGTTKLGTPRYKKLDGCHLNQWYPGQVSWRANHKWC